MRAIAGLCAVTLLLAGCTGGGTASYYFDKVQEGMTQDEVRQNLGNPDIVRGTDFPVEGQPVLEWEYQWHTPSPFYILPTLLLFTIVLTIPAFYVLMGLGMSGTGGVWVDFGLDGRVSAKRGVFGTGF